MQNKDINFKGVLSNVNASVADMVFDHNFKIEHFPANEGIDLISRIGVNPNKEFLRAELLAKKCIDYSLENKGEIYFICNSFKDIPEAEERVERYLLPSIKLMRLFKEGSINLPIAFYYSTLNEQPFLDRISFSNDIYCTKEKYSLRGTEISELINFIDNIRENNNKHLYFDNPILQSAYDTYDLSYYAHSTATGLLDLAIGFEALFNPSNEGELKFRISRNAAILIGNNRDDSKRIYVDIKNFNDKRSNLVHTGMIGEKFGVEEFLKIRSYLRESIKRFYRFSIEHPHVSRKGKHLEKDDLLKLLEFSEFGESPVN